MLNRNVEERMYNTLWEAISLIRSKHEIVSSLNDLLTPNERIMVAKRLGIAILLVKNTDYDTIKDMLKVSNETISKVSTILKISNGYRTMVKKILRSEAGRQFWQDVESLIYRWSSPGKVFMPEEAIKYRLGHKKKTLA